MSQQIFVRGPQHPACRSSSIAIAGGDEEQQHDQLLPYEFEDDDFEPEDNSESDLLLQALFSDQCDSSIVLSDILEAFGAMAEPATAEATSAANAQETSTDHSQLGDLSKPDAPGSPPKRQREEEDGGEDGPDPKRLRGDSRPEPHHDTSVPQADSTHQTSNDEEAAAAQAASEELLRQSGLLDELEALTQAAHSANTNGNAHETQSQENQPQRAAADEPFELGAIDDWVKSALEDSNGYGDHDGTNGGGHVAEAMMEDTPAQTESVPALKGTAHLAELSFLADPSNYVKNTSLPSLGNLSMLILETLGSDEVLDEPKSECRQRFDGLSCAYEGIAALYSNADGSFCDSSNLLDPDASKILTVAKLAQLSVWAIKGQTPPALDSHIDALVQELPDSTTVVVDLYVEMQTQGVLDSLLAKEPEKSSIEIIESAFNTSQADSTASMQRRADELKATVSADDIATISTLYSVGRSLQRFVLFSRRHLSIMPDLTEKLGVYISEIPVPESPEPTAESILFGESDLDSLVNNVLANVGDGEPATTDVKVESVEVPSSATQTTNPPAPVNGFAANDYESLSALVAESTDNYVRTTLNSLTPTPYQPTVPPSTTESMTAHLNSLQQNNTQASYYAFAQTLQSQQAHSGEQTGGDLPPHQSVPTATLYDRARQAALSKNTTHARREGVTSTRRPWSQEEEKALMAGLDMVKGPHWSQILTLFGINGTISDVLRDRSQVQLKDKARNLKLFFLKTNSEMPFYLHAVTGELKTRAPGQAARKEAEERARINSEEEQARVQGIMTLAGGLQHPPQNRASGSPSAAVGAGVVTPAQAAAQAQANGSVQPSNRPTTAQQMLHAMPQQQQTRMPPHLPRLETQHTPTQQASQPSTAPRTPTIQLPASTPTMTPAATPPQPSPFTQPQNHFFTQNSAASMAMSHPSTGMKTAGSSYPAPKMEANSPVLPGTVQDENAADAEILRGLQAAIAEHTAEQAVKVEASGEA